MQKAACALEFREKDASKFVILNDKNFYENLAGSGCLYCLSLLALVNYRETFNGPVGVALSPIPVSCLQTVIRPVNLRA